MLTELHHKRKPYTHALKIDKGQIKVNEKVLSGIKSEKLSGIGLSKDGPMDNEYQYSVTLLSGSSLAFAKVLSEGSTIDTSPKMLDYSSDGVAIRLFRNAEIPISPPDWLIGKWSDDTGIVTYEVSKSSVMGPQGDLTKLFLSDQAYVNPTLTLMKWYSLTYGTLQSRFTIQFDQNLTFGGSSSSVQFTVRGPGETVQSTGSLKLKT